VPYKLFPRVRRAIQVGAVASSIVGALSCGREPTDPARSDLTGLWKSFGPDYNLRDVEMELHQVQPGVVVGKWRAIGKINGDCPPQTFCKDSSIIQGRNEVAQIVIHLFGAGDFVGEHTSTDELKGVIRSFEQNFHVTFHRN